jgi:undecaprenyl-diphosphatase
MHRVLPARLSLTLLMTGVLALLVLLVPLPGQSLSVAVTGAMSAFGFAVPAVEHLSDGALLALAVVTAIVGTWSWRRRKDRRAAAVGAVIGVVIAYAASEGLKLLLAQSRPCTRWPAAGVCDAADFSLPSNHAALAFAAVVVIAVAARGGWLTLAALFFAFIVAAARMLEGAHYLHDVAAGALIGLAVPAITAWAACRMRARRLGHGH